MPEAPACPACQRAELQDIEGQWVCTHCGCVEGAVYVLERTAPPPSLAQRQEDDEENWYREYPDQVFAFSEEDEEE